MASRLMARWPGIALAAAFLLALRAAGVAANQVDYGNFGVLLALALAALTVAEAARQ